MVELVDEADVVAADRGALVVGQPAAGATVEDHVAGVRPLQQAGQMQQRRLAGAGRRDQRHHLGAAQREVGAVQDRQLLLTLDIVPFDALQFDDRPRHSYLRASTGSSLAARQAGNSVAMNDSTSAISTTEMVSLMSILAGSCDRK